MAIYTLTPQQLKGAGVYNSFEIPAGGGSSFTNTYSVAFDGTDDYVNVADNSNLSFGDTVNDSPFSISCWVNVSQLTTGHNLIKKRNDSSSVYKWEYDAYLTSTGTINFRIFDVASLNRRERTTSTGLITINTWNHIVFTYNGVGGTNANLGMKIYLNGIRVDNAGFGKNTYIAMHNTNEPFRIGASITGNMDEVAIFNSELSLSDVTSIYNDGTPNDLSSYSSLVSWWRMGDDDGGTGTTVTDQGSGGNDGTLISDATFEEDVPS